MVLISFLLMFLYIIYDIYFDILNIFIENKVLKISILLSIIYIVSQIIILPMFSKNLSPFALHSMYILLCLSVYIFCIFLIRDVGYVFKINENFWSPILIFIFSIAISSIYGYFNNNIQITRYNIETEKEANTKIIFLSDLHIGNKGINEKQIKDIVSIINKENPDLLIFGGDTIEKEDTFLKTKNITRIIQHIKTKNIYGVLGNHEYYFDNNPQSMRDLMEKNYKIDILEDEFVKFNDDLIIIGRLDYFSKYFGVERKSLDKILENVDKNNFIIVVDHNPINFEESIENNIDLQLSGHTHGGQFFPFTIANRLFYKRLYGFFKEKNSRLIISSGVGTSGIPLRIMTKKELVIINIKSKTI